MINFILLVFAILLALAIIMQIARLNDLGKSLQDDSKDDTKGFATSSLIFVLVSIAAVFYFYYTHYAFKPHLLPESASIHGKEIDRLFDVTGYMTGFVFVVTQILLVYFVYAYKGKKGQKGFFYPVNHKLEIWWTVIPSIFLVYLVFTGMKSWYSITSLAPKDSQIIEVIGEQFKWDVRYPGADNILGGRKFELIGKDDGKNILGVDWNSPGAKDDFMVDEIHLLVNKSASFYLGSKDVIHSFFLPHFRVQQNCVPGMPTLFHFVPTITTKEMREKTEDGNFDYWLACAAICGSSHYNMKMKVVVDDAASYNAWFNEQKKNAYYFTVINPDAKPAADATMISKDTIIDKKAIEVKDTTVVQKVETASH